MEKLLIKNMVCDRCKMVVDHELRKVGVKPFSIALGVVELDEALSSDKKTQVKAVLESVGFELLDDKKSQIIEAIKNTIVDLVHHNGKKPRTNFSDYLAKTLGKDYSQLSSLFSDIEGVTIEHYLINQRIERVKELLVYDELSLGQIATDMGYSSIAHLSNQFKKVTGLTPTHFKSIGASKRKGIDKV